MDNLIQILEGVGEPPQFTCMSGCDGLGNCTCGVGCPCQHTPEQRLQGLGEPSLGTGVATILGIGAVGFLVLEGMSKGYGRRRAKAIFGNARSLLSKAWNRRKK